MLVNICLKQIMNPKLSYSVGKILCKHKYKKNPRSCLRCKTLQNVSVPEFRTFFSGKKLN